MIDKLIQELESLQKAKQLLDDILVHYSIYGKQFEGLDDYDADKLNNKIRNYKQFDDSE